MGGRPHEVVPVRETKMGVPGTKSDSHRHFRRSSLGRRPSLFLLVLTLGVAWYKYQAHSRKRAELRCAVLCSLLVLFHMYASSASCSNYDSN